MCSYRSIIDVPSLWRGFPYEMIARTRVSADVHSLPLITISVVRTVSFTIYTATKRILNSTPEDLTQSPGAGSSKAPWIDARLGLFNQNTARDVAVTSLLAGGASGSVVCLGSAPFELVKVSRLMSRGRKAQYRKVRRQLEYQIYRDSHPHLFAPDRIPDPGSSPNQSTGRPQTRLSPPPATSFRPPRPPPFILPTTLQAVRMIISTSGYRGLYTGCKLHFVRDTLGTALYFAEYDVMRHMLGRERRDDELIQGDVPDWTSGWLPEGVHTVLVWEFGRRQQLGFDIPRRCEFSNVFLRPI